MIVKKVGYSSAHPVHKLKSVKVQVKLISIKKAKAFEILYNQLYKL